MNPTDEFALELIVSNHSGVLNRVTSLYARRGYNIDTLHVREKDGDPGLSRVWIASRGDENVRTQMVRQLAKLYDVMEVRQAE